jgi:hypothetical protein
VLQETGDVTRHHTKIQINRRIVTYFRVRPDALAMGICLIGDKDRQTLGVFSRITRDLGRA